MKIFIDCGAYKGSAIKKFKESNTDYEIYAFEPNPFMPCNFGDDVTVIRKAVWIEDCTNKFYLKRHKARSNSSSLYKNKCLDRHPLDKNHPVFVECVDFGEWILVVCGMYNVVKMDIEGAEYEVLEKMIETGRIKCINELWIEWHWSKLNGLVSYKRHKKLKDYLTDLGILKGEYFDTKI